MVRWKDLYYSLESSAQDVDETHRGPFTRTAKATTPGCGMVFATGQLRDYLLSALAVVKTLEQDEEESQKPKTVAEVEILEERLIRALEELRVRKAQLEQEAA